MVKSVTMESILCELVTHLNGGYLYFGFYDK